MTAPSAMIASTFFDVARRRTASGSSNAPGTRTTTTFFASAPWRTSASTAPSTRRSTTKWLKRLATTAKRAPFGTTRFPSITRVAMLSSSFAATAHRVQRHLLDDVEPEAVDTRNLTRVVGEQADLVHPQVRQDLRAQAELAQRGIVARRGHPGRWPGLERRAQRVELALHVAARRDVDQGAAAR